MKQFKRFFNGATKRLLQHEVVRQNTCQAMMGWDESHVAKVFSAIPLSSKKLQTCPINTHVSSNASMIGKYEHVELENGFSTPISSTQTRQGQEPQNKQCQESTDRYLCKDIPILEKLEQGYSQVVMATPPERRNGKKRSFKNANGYSGDNLDCVELKQPFLKRQRMVSNDNSKYYNSKTQIISIPRQGYVNLTSIKMTNNNYGGRNCNVSTKSRGGQLQHLGRVKKRSRNTLINAYGSNMKLEGGDEPQLKRRRRLQESVYSPSPTTGTSPTQFCKIHKRHDNLFPMINNSARIKTSSRHSPTQKPNKRKQCLAMINYKDNKRIGNKAQNIMFISNILSDVMTCLDFSQIFKLRGLSKFHEKEFYFKFEINKQMGDDHFNLYFEYNNGYILNILKTQISDNISNIAMYGLQCINYKMKKWFVKNVKKIDNNTTTMGIPQRLNVLSFETHSDSGIDDNSNDNENDYIFEWSKNTHTIVDVGRKVTSTHTSYLHASSICNNVINPLFKYHGCHFKIHNSNKNTFSFVDISNDCVNNYNCCSNGNSCNKSVCNSHFCSPGTGFIYSCDINPFRELHSQMKQIQKQISCLSFDVNHMTEYMIIGNIYHIYPLCNTLDTLLYSNDCFRHTIMHKKAECFEIDKNNKKWYKHGNNLMYLWNNMGLMRSCFSCRDRWQAAMEGRTSLFCDLSLRGDFAQYKRFVQFESREKYNIGCGCSIKDGVDVLAAMFLRLDILDEMTYLPKCVFFGREILLYLLKPKLLLEYKQNLLDSMIPLTPDDDYQFSLYDNLRYSPEKRVLFLWKLLFSTKFARSHNCTLIRNFESYIELRKCIKKLYNSFDDFEKEWELDKYDSFKNNDTKKKQLYQDLQCVIQALFGFCDWYNRSDGTQTGIFTIADMIEKNRQKNGREDPFGMDMQEKQDFDNVCSFAVEDVNDKLINVMPRNEDQLHSLWRVMIGKEESDTIKDELQFPRFDQLFQEREKPLDNNVLVFVPVLHLDVFISQLWHIGQRWQCT